MTEPNPVDTLADTLADQMLAGGLTSRFIRHNLRTLAQACARAAWEQGFKADPTGSYDGDVERYGGNPYDAQKLTDG